MPELARKQGSSRFHGCPLDQTIAKIQPTAPTRLHGRTSTKVMKTMLERTKRKSSRRRQSGCRVVVVALAWRYELTPMISPHSCVSDKVHDGNKIQIVDMFAYVNIYNILS